MRYFIELTNNLKTMAGKEMTEDIFWGIIASFDWDKTGDDDAVLKPALDTLISMSVSEIQEFAEILAEKLYNLDGILYASNIGPYSYQGDNVHFSVDYFLYVRCCVVANGKDYYYHVINNPTAMPKEMDFEGLLYLSDNAYNAKLNTEGEYLQTKLSFETFSNVAAWQAG